MNSDPRLEDLMGQLGGFSKYQLTQYLLHCLACFTSGVHMLSLTFVAKTPQHRCFLDEFDYKGNPEPSFDPQRLSRYIPLTPDGSLDSCRMFYEGNATLSCSQYIYDRSVFRQSRVYDWDMVCEDKWRRAFIQSIYVFGVVCGALICGSLADKVGRKPILYLSGLLQLTFGIMGPFITNYALYCGSLFFYGMFGSAGGLVTSFVLTAELLPKKAKLYCGILYGSWFSIGVCLIAFWAYLIRDITILQVLLACHSLVLFGHWWLMDESIRWLWSQGRIKDAIAICRKGCGVNGIKFEDKEIYHSSSVPKGEIEPEIKSYGLLDLFRTRRLRLRSIIISLIWFSTSMTYYGVAFNTGKLAGDPFIVFFFVSFFDLIGDGILMLLVDRIGRRTLTLSYMLFCAGAFFTIAFLPSGGLEITIISFVAKACCASSFRLIYNYTGEMFPTVVRNSSLGFGSFSARVAGMLAPQVLLLSTVHKVIPPLIIGGIDLISVLLAALFLPETLRKNLPQTIDDGERFGKGDDAISFIKQRFNPTLETRSRKVSNGDAFHEEAELKAFSKN